MNKTGIDYLDYTWNPTKGCSPVSPGCAGCWAKAMAKRLAGMKVRGYSVDDPFKVVCFPEKLDEPMKVKKPSRIGVSFMGDLFHPDVDDKEIDSIFAIMVLCHEHTFMLLTKRPTLAKRWFDLANTFGSVRPRIHREAARLCQLNKSSEHVPFFPVADEKDFLVPRRHYARLTLGHEGWLKWPLPNVHLGVTVCTPDELWKIKELLKIPAAHHFVSFEPLLADLGDISYYLNGCPEIVSESRCFDEENEWQQTCPPLDLVILGGESGSNARHMDPDWARSVKRQCEDAGVAFHMKQMSGNTKAKREAIPKDLRDGD